MATKKLGSIKATDTVLVTSVDLAADVGSSILPVANGGSGTGTYTNGQIMIGNTAGNTLVKSTITQSSANQVIVTNGAGSITLSLPQDISTASTVQFGSVGVGVAAGGFSVSVMPKSDSNGLFVVRRASGANSGSYWGFFVQNPGATDSFILGQSNSLNGGPLGWIAANDAFCYYPSGRFVWGNSHPTITMSSGNNLQLGGDTTSATLVGATADIVSMAGVDRLNTRHPAAGNRLEGIQSERGSAIWVGDDAIEFAATTAIITVNATDLLSMTSTVLTVSSTTDSTSSSTGSLQVLGGAVTTKNHLSLQGQGWGVTSIATAAGTTTLTSSSKVVQIFTGSTTQTVTLPAANLFGTGIAVIYVIKNRSSGTVTINRAGSDTIDGLASVTLTGGANASVTLASDGVSAWVIV